MDLLVDYKQGQGDGEGYRLGVTKLEPGCLGSVCALSLACWLKCSGSGLNGDDTNGPALLEF